MTRQLTFERVFSSPSLSGPAPRLAKLSPDGRFLALLRNRAEERERYDLWAWDRHNDEWRMLVDSEALGSGRELSEAEKMQRERQRLGGLKGIVAYSWSADGQSVLVPLDGELFLAGLDGSVQRLGGTGAELDPKLSPKGGYLSFVRDRRLCVGEVGQDVCPITPLEEPDTVHWGEAEFVAQEELDRTSGYWWAPDDGRIAVQRFDEGPVSVVTRTAIGASGTSTFDQRYPAAGEPNAKVSLFLIDPDGGNRVEVDLGPDEDIYLARVDWAPDAGTLFVQRLDRAQTRLDLLAVDPATGAARLVFSEQAAQGHWINLSNAYRFLRDGSLLWWSERDGFGHLYRYEEGEWTQLTNGAWMVTRLLGVDQDAGRVYFMATKDDVLAQQVYVLDLARPGEIDRLTDPVFDNAASMDNGGQTLFVSRSSPTQPPQSYIADGSGKRLAWIEQNPLDDDHPYAPFLAGHREPEFGTIVAEDGQDLHWMMVTPEMEPGKRYPVFFYHYGGPHAQIVTRGWADPAIQAIVDKGYIWFALDNRGSANRGVAFEQPLYRAMGGPEVRDQKAGAEFLGTLPFVDPAKIAIDGWSYGGYMTLKMLEADPGFYAAGICGAPVSRWDLYDTAYTERYMGTPQAEREAYAASSVVAEVTKIADPLLMIHGMSDDNVVLENSTEVIAALQEANIAFEMMLYPGYTHRVAGPRISPHRFNTMFRFLADHGVTPPE